MMIIIIIWRNKHSPKRLPVQPLGTLSMCTKYRKDRFNHLIFRVGYAYHQTIKKTNMIIIMSLSTVTTTKNQKDYRNLLWIQD